MYRVPAAITMATASASLAALRSAIDGDESDIALDATAHSDSSAVAVILAAIRHAQRSGRTLRFSGLPASLHSLAKLYGVEPLIDGGPTV